MFRILFALIALSGSVPALANCNESALQGTWTVFYRDNAFPTSVLAADETIYIGYNPGKDEFSVSFSDNDWAAWDGGWSSSCVDGQTVLIGAIKQRRGKTTLVIEMSRVTDPNDLLARSNGMKRPQQINIHFPDRYAQSAASHTFDATKRKGYLASHPGHAHADL